MKLNSILSATLVAAVSMLSMGAQAADGGMGAEGKTSAAASMPAEKAAPMKPHSHMEAKGGMAPKASAPKPEQSNPAKDMSKHYHPRDAK